MQEVLLQLLLPLYNGGGCLCGAQQDCGGGPAEGGCGGQRECLAPKPTPKKLLMFVSLLLQINYYVSDCLYLDKHMEFGKSIIGVCLSTRTTFTGWTVIQKYMLCNKESLFQNYNYDK